MKCGGGFSNHVTANLLENLSVKKMKISWKLTELPL